MKSKVKQKITFLLELNETEARWLKTLVQNPVGCTYEDEPEEHKEIRKAFWDALDGLQVSIL